MKAMTELAGDLRRLAQAARRRVLAPREGLDFSSNDYLALAGSDRLRDAVIAAIKRGVPAGSGGSRLLRGNTLEHETLEHEAARFFGAQSAVYIGSGYAANALLFSTLPQTGDLIVHDALIHASAHEGIRLSRAAARSFAHNDATAAEAVLKHWRATGGIGTPWIAVESLYSMDGDVAPLAEFVALADRHDAMLLIDEAHATGVFGTHGRGLADALDGRDNVISLKTCGKALGCEGALLVGPEPLRDFIVNRGRSFIFSTAPSPLMAAVVREGLRILRDEPDRRTRLQALVGHARTEFARIGIEPSKSQIQPVIIGDDRRTMIIAERLQDAGFDVRGIRPPTVATGTARLRISLTLNVDQRAISRLAATLGRIL